MVTVICDGMVFTGHVPTHWITPAEMRFLHDYIVICLPSCQNQLEVTVYSHSEWVHHLLIIGKTNTYWLLLGRQSQVTVGQHGGQLECPAIIDRSSPIWSTVSIFESLYIYEYSLDKPGKKRRKRYFNTLVKKRCMWENLWQILRMKEVVQKRWICVILLFLSAQLAVGRDCWLLWWFSLYLDRYTSITKRKCLTSKTLRHLHKLSKWNLKQKKNL